MTTNQGHLLMASIGLIGLVGCGQAPVKGFGVIPGTESDHPNSKSSLFRVNPNPERKYELTLTIEDAPGPIDYARGYAQFLAPNCRYVISDLMGVGASPEVYLPVEVRQTGTNQFKSVVALDAMQDADYYGTGKCSWKLALVAFEWSADKAPGVTTFSSVAAGEEVASSTPSTRMYAKKFYPTSLMGDANYPGLSDPQIAELKDRATVFSAVIVSKEISK